MTQSDATKNMTLAPGVIDTIISIATSEHDGVACVGSPVVSGFRSLFFQAPSTSGIETKFNAQDELEIELHITVFYGYVIPELADQLRTTIAEALLVQAGVRVSQIDIFVDGIQFKEQA